MGLLVTTVIWALFVATTLWFPFRRGPIGFGIFVVTMACNEIPLVLLLVFVVSVIVSLGDAAAEPAAMIAALVVACLVTVGMVWLQVRARSVRPAFEAALSAGSGRRLARLASDPSSSPLPRPRAHRGCTASCCRSSGTRSRCSACAMSPTRRAGALTVLDIYRRTDAATRRPVVIHLHGGGFVQGGKSRESVALLNQLADHGWLCVSANYRLRSAGAFPQSLVDTKRVIAWVRAHAGEQGADPDQIFLVGGSAGGHLAISAALTADDPRFQPGFEQADTRVAGAVSLYGYLGPRAPIPPALRPVSPGRMPRPS